MAVYFLNIKTFGRAGNSSAVSAAAYRSGERLHDERAGKSYDHSARQDVMHKEIVLPSRFTGDDVGWAHDRNTLWNTAEHAETRRNARVAREYLVALPAELNPEQQVSLTRGFAHELADRYGFALDVAIHEPRAYPDSDPRNFHAHLLATTREVQLEGLGGKTSLEWNDATRRVAGMGPGIGEFLHVRHRWAEVTNEALLQAEVNLRIDHRTLRDQGIDREPYPYIPRAAFEMERHGYRSSQAERIREEYAMRVEARERERQREQQKQSQRSGAPEKPKTLEEVRREAREGWLRLREGRAEAMEGAPSEKARVVNPTRDEDLTR